MWYSKSEVIVKLSQIKSQKIPSEALTKRKLFFSGPVGCAKTTLAIALAEHHTGIEYGPGCIDIRRINCAEITIEDIRKLILELRYAPFQTGAKCKGYVLDELHVLPDKSEKALLVPIEEDKHNFWAGCTNFPDQVSPAMLSRLSLHIPLRAPSPETITEILIDEGMEPIRAAVIAKNCNGDLRRALSGSSDDFDYETELLGVRDAGQLLRLARRNPLQVQATLLNQYLKSADKHSALAGYLNTASYEVAAHQLVSLARRAGIIK